MSSSYDPTDLAAQELARESLEEKQRLELDNEEADWKWLLEGKRGRRIAWRLLQQSGVFNATFDTNAMRMAFQEGQRNFGNRLFAMLDRAQPDALVLILKEKGK